MCHVSPPYMCPQIKRVNADAYKKTFEEIVRNIDKMENECIPSVTLSKQEVKISHHFPSYNSVTGAVTSDALCKINCLLIMPL